MADVQDSRPLDTYASVREWRRGPDYAEGVALELAARIDYVLPPGQHNVGDELRAALRVATEYAYLTPVCGNASAAIVVVVIELLARIEAELEADEIRAAELDDWYRRVHGGADA